MAESLSLKIANVALNIPSENLFSYLIPSELQDSIKPGHLVDVPLRNREAIGLVVEISGYKTDGKEDTGDLKDLKDLKEIIALPYPEPVLDKTLLDLARWMSDYYFCPLGITIRTLIPTGIIPEKIAKGEGGSLFRPKGKEKSVTYISIAKADQEILQYILSNKKKAHKQCYILEELLAKGGKSLISEFPGKGVVPNAAINSLISKGLINKSKERTFRDPYKNIKSQREYCELILNNEQEAALDRLGDALNKREFSAFLLHGITGSGKTEIYLRLILKAIEKGLQAIVLVPEIAITHQLVDRFKYYLGDRIAVLHSHISSGERLDEWLRIKKGLANVVIGARSAIFAPFQKLGIIVCDEEHDSSYKQESHPRYHGRDVAIMRAKMSRCLICLGSATPSIESYYNTQIQKYHLLSLPNRVTVHPLPRVQMIDMREEYKRRENTEKDISENKERNDRKNNGWKNNRKNIRNNDNDRKAEVKKDESRLIFSDKLFKAMEETLKRGEQVLIFHNRRGHSPFLLCPKCGYVPKCPNCSVSLTYHLTEKILRCHYCGYQSPPPEFCKFCKEIPFEYIGYGTQKIEHKIKDIFPGYTVARMDRDTTSRKHGHYNILSRLEDGKTDILVGTQMVTKGLDIPNITLVGVTGADYILNLPDFRATERVFQMITQVAGRAGRGKEPGNVLVQTFYPYHYSLIFAARHDYISFYSRETSFRRQLMYPPFSRLVCIIVMGRERKITRKAANFFGKQIKVNINPKEVRCLGPSMAPLFRLKGMHRYQIMLKSRDYRISHALVRDALVHFSKEKEFRNIRIDIDVDPVNLL